MTHDNGARPLLSPGDFMEEYRLDLVRQRKPAHTVQTYLGDVRAFLEHFEREGGSHFPGGVRTADVAAPSAWSRPPPSRHHPPPPCRPRQLLPVGRRCAALPRLPHGGPGAAPPRTLEQPLRRALDVRDKRRFLRTVKEHGTCGTRPCASCSSPPPSARTNSST
ncbi:hypothetical protein ACN28S_67820 [Cystobacter fuscus]